MKPEPSLLIIASMPDELDLAQLPLRDEASAEISVNRAKFKDMEMAEVIVDAMPFLLTRLTAAETGQQIAAMNDATISRDRPSATESAIGVALGDNLTSARHLTEVNRRLLLLGKWIGEGLKASGAAWMPSRRLVPFADYDKIVCRYMADGAFPVSFLTSFSEVQRGEFRSRGLRYFSGQEIRLTAPADYSPSVVIERLGRIIEDLTSRGKIDRPARADGIIPGETLIYNPSDDLGHVDIDLRNDSFNTDPAKI